MSPCDEDGGLIFHKHIRSSRSVMFRLLKHPALTDVVLICGTTSLPAHRILLATCSPYLKEMLIKEEISGSRPYRLVLSDVDKSTAEILLEFAYTGRLNVSSKNFAAVKSAMEAAHQLQVSALYRRCADLIVGTLTPTNVTDVWELGELCGDGDLAERSIDLLARQLETRYRTTRYLGLPMSKFRSVMVRAALLNSQSRSSDSLMRAALAWVKHDRKNRSDLLAELLRSVQDTNQTPSTLLGLITPEKGTSDVVEESTKEEITDLYTPEGTRTEPEEVELSEDKEVDTTPTPTPTPKIQASSPNLVKVPLLLLISINRVDRVVLEMFDLMQEEWVGFHEDISTNFLFHGSASICLGSTVFFFGGESKTGEKLSTCVAFQVTHFFPIASMKISKSWASAGLLEAMLYCVGGHSKYNYSLSHVERYCPNHDTWKIIAPLRKARANATVATAGGRLIAMGGMDGNEWLNSCEMYDPEVNEWTEVASLPSDFGNCQLQSAVYEDAVFVIKSQRPKCAARLDTDSATWKMSSKFTGNIPRRIQELTIFGEQMYAVDDKRRLYVYYLHSQLWERIGHSPGADSGILISIALMNKNDVFVDLNKKEAM